MEQESLKPCPFCGGEAVLQRSSGDPFGEGRVSFRAVCEKPMCQGGACNVWKATPKDAAAAWNTRAERECRFTLEEDREALAEKAACGPGEFVTQDMPDLLWTCSACGEQYRNGLYALPGWLKHCPNCGAKVTR